MGDVVGVAAGVAVGDTVRVEAVAAEVAEVVGAVEVAAVEPRVVAVGRSRRCARWGRRGGGAGDVVEVAAVGQDGPGWAKASCTGSS